VGEGYKRELGGLLESYGRVVRLWFQTMGESYGNGGYEVRENNMGCVGNEGVVVRGKTWGYG
jgi:hypothetical protein